VARTIKVFSKEYIEIKALLSQIKIQNQEQLPHMDIKKETDSSNINKIISSPPV
jgi:hypothetical protein